MNQHKYCKGVISISVGEPIVDDEFFSTVTGLNFKRCMNSTHYPSEIGLLIAYSLM